MSQTGIFEAQPLPSPSSLRPAAAMLAKVLLDKTASVLRFALSRPLPIEQWPRIVAETKTAVHMWRERGWVERPASYHVPPPGLSAAEARIERAPRQTTLRLSFESGYEPHADEPGRGRWMDYRSNATAHAYLLRHPGCPRPWIVCIHGYGTGFPFVDGGAFGVKWLHEELGLNVALPVLPFHGPRRTGWQSGDGFFAGDVLDTLHAEAQALWDLRRVVSWIRAQEAETVGAYGLSLGGYNAALLAAFDPNLQCAIAGVPVAEFVELGRLHSQLAASRAEAAGIDWSDVTRLYRVISPLALMPQIPRRRRFIFGGRADCIVPATQVDRLWRRWGRAQITWHEGTHLSCPFESTVRQFVGAALKATLLQSASDEQRDVRDVA